MTKHELPRPGSMPVGDSPIEIALFESVRDAVPLFGFANFLPFASSEPRHREAPVLYWAAQIWLLDWPVDFIFTVLHPKKPEAISLVVECDGHEFHERTKEQAARDRSRDRRLQSAGYTVFRFTGAEIYSQRNMVARQILEWAGDMRGAAHMDAGT